MTGEKRVQTWTKEQGNGAPRTRFERKGEERWGGREEKKVGLAKIRRTRPDRIWLCLPEAGDSETVIDQNACSLSCQRPAGAAGARLRETWRHATGDRHCGVGSAGR